MGNSKKRKLEVEHENRNGFHEFDYDSWHKSKKPHKRAKFLFEHRHLVPEDVRFKVGVSGPKQKYISAHKIILAMGSPMFYRQLFGSIPIGDDICVEDVSPHIFNYILRYIYSGEEDFIREKNVFDILYASNKYLLQKLSRTCRIFIQSSLTSLNCCRFYRKSIKIGEITLARNARSMMMAFPQIALGGTDFFFLDAAAIIEILQEPNINMEEFELFGRIHKWAEKEAENEGNLNDDAVSEKLKPILPFIRFSAFPDYERKNPTVLKYHSFEELSNEIKIPARGKVIVPEEHSLYLYDDSDGSLKGEVVIRLRPDLCHMEACRYVKDLFDERCALSVHYGFNLKSSEAACRTFPKTWGNQERAFLKGLLLDGQGQSLLYPARGVVYLSELAAGSDRVPCPAELLILTDCHIPATNSKSIPVGHVIRGIETLDKIFSPNPSQIQELLTGIFSSASPNEYEMNDEDSEISVDQADDGSDLDDFIEHDTEDEDGDEEEENVVHMDDLEDNEENPFPFEDEVLVEDDTEPDESDEDTDQSDSTEAEENNHNSREVSPERSPGSGSDASDGDSVIIEDGESDHVEDADDIRNDILRLVALEEEPFDFGEFRAVDDDDAFL